MKYKHKIEKLNARIKHWDSMKPNDQHATTRPGSQKK